METSKSLYLVGEFSARGAGGNLLRGRVHLQEYPVKSFPVPGGFWQSPENVYSNEGITCKMTKKKSFRQRG
ncbi:hypothetical protein EFA69_13425 [Rufibacter immobilis]|uniref:Uncharacterized protein n=1 Tax=Rufibacter immobilis TaxID=1348778 RepID=A0A3M9MNP8_9BACT|nr:hypothetical protein EFA69_13425 [Rufibacter immobilis]